MNRHMNLFHFYGENVSNESLENNLTRGLALCLKYDPLLLSSFISKIDSNFKKHKILSQDEMYFEIDIQVQANSLEAEKIIAVSITLDNYTEQEYLEVKARKTKSPVIDLVIAYANTAIICEIKPSRENCLAQLKNQVKTYIEDGSETFRSFSWVDMNTLLENTINLRKSMEAINHITSDYLIMLQGHFPEWHQIPKLDELTINSKNQQFDINKRLNQVCKELKKVGFKNRSNFQLDWSLASELKIESNVPNDIADLSEIDVNFIFWAGDTKWQGYSLFKDDYVQKLIIKKDLKVEKQKYKLSFQPYFKFSSYQRGQVWFQIEEKYYHDFNNKLFKKLAGRKKRHSWDMVDKSLLKFDKNWKEKSNWNEKIENSGKTQIDISMGVKVVLAVPFNELLISEKEKCLENKLQVIISALNLEFRNQG